MHRGPGFGESVKYWVKPDIENRVKEGSIAAHFNANVAAIRLNEVVLDTGVTLPADSVLLLTGYRADPDFMRGMVASRSRRHAVAAIPHRHLRDERARIICRRRAGGGEANRHRVHRERPFPRRVIAKRSRLAIAVARNAGCWDTFRRP